MLTPLLAALCLLTQTPSRAEETSAPSTAAPVVAAPRPLTSAGSQLGFRVALGEEWDSNARRAITSGAIGAAGNGPPTGPPVGDAVTRLLVDTEGSLELAPGHSLYGEYVLGAKRFLTRDTEDLIVHDLRASSQHRLADGWSLGPWGIFRASRTRSNVRDYSLGGAGARLDFLIGDLLIFEAGGSFFDFDFKPDPHLSYVGPTASGEILLKASSRLSFALHVDESWRFFSKNGLVQTLANPPGTTFCEMAEENCTPVKRRDRETLVALRGEYRGPLLAGVEYLFRAQRSNSDYENTDRHRISAYLTVPLPFELTGNLLAALQINSGVSVSQTKLPFDDDENQNSFQAQLSRRLTDALGLDLRYALFANQFATAGVRFFRQTIYLGMSYRLGVDRGS